MIYHRMCLRHWDLKPLLIYDLVEEHCKNAADHMLETIEYISHIISNILVTNVKQQQQQKIIKKGFN